MKTLFNANAKRENVVAYCCYHRVWITKNQMRQKACLSKQCGALMKIQCQYWENRKKRKAEAKAKRKWKYGLH